MLGCLRHDLGAGAGLAGEGDLVHTGVGHQKLAGLSAGAGYHIEHPGRRADLLHNPGQLQHRQWCERSGLHDHRVARCQRGRDLQSSQPKRKIPGGDPCDHAQGFPPCVVQILARHGDSLPKDGRSDAGKILKEVGSSGKIVGEDLLDGSTGLLRLEARQLLHLLYELVCDRGQEFPTLFGGLPTPARGSLSSGLDRLPDLILLGHGAAGDDLLLGGVLHLEVLFCLQPFAIEIEPIFLHSNSVL